MSWTLLSVLAFVLALALFASRQRRAELARMRQTVGDRERAVRQGSDKAQLQPSFDLFVSVLSRPDFPGADFKRERQRTLTGLEYQKQKPKSILEKTFYQSCIATTLMRTVLRALKKVSKRCG